MGSLIYKPPAGGDVEAVEVRGPAGTVVYTFSPSVPTDVPVDHYAYVQAALLALEGTIPTPAAPAVAPAGVTGATTYGYRVVAVGANGDTPQSPETQITNGNASLAGGNGNTVTWAAPAALAGAVASYKVIRSTGGATQGLVGTVTASSPRSFTDAGGAATVYTPSVTNPAQVAVASGPAEV